MCFQVFGWSIIGCGFLGELGHVDGRCEVWDVD